jgi:predicted TIM-barrel fold metal-dependent hydrolase
VAEKSQRGEIDHYRIIDIHQHIGEVYVGAEVAKAWNAGEDLQRRVAKMDEYGFTMAAISPSLQYERASGFQDTQRMNSVVAAYRDARPDRFPLAFGTVDPLQGVANGVNEIRRMATDLKMDGVVWHHRFQGTFIADPRMYPFLDAMRKLKLPALIHLMAESTMEAHWGIETLAEAYPDITFVGIDAFSGATQSRFMMMLAKRVPNLMFETAAFFPVGRIIEEFVSKFGSERLLFGTDLYFNPEMYHYPYVLYEVRDAPTLTEDDKRNIFWNNADRLFGLSAKLASIEAGREDRQA